MSTEIANTGTQNPMHTAVAVDKAASVSAAAVADGAAKSGVFFTPKVLVGLGHLAATVIGVGVGVGLDQEQKNGSSATTGGGTGGETVAGISVPGGPERALVLAIDTSATFTGIATTTEGHTQLFTSRSRTSRATSANRRVSGLQ
jgi:hypothetical protein